MSRQNVLSFNVYKNTLRRAEGFQPVSGGRGYSKIVCRFRSDDWAAENDELSAGFFVTPRNVIGVTGTVVANTDETAPEHAQLLAEFAIPTEILRQRLPFYVGIAGVYDEGDVVIATNTVRVDTARGIVVDELSGNEEIMSNYEVLMGTLNGKAAKTYVDAQDTALEQRVSDLESGKADAATTLEGYGITDAYTKAETDTALGEKEDKSNKVLNDISSSDGTNDKYPSVKALLKYLSDYYLPAGETYGRTQIDEKLERIDEELNGKEDKSNRATSMMTDALSGQDTTVLYPTVHAVRNYLDYRLGFYALEDHIPTAVSELENDSGYLTAHQDISGKADKADTYTKAQVDTALGGKADTATTLAGYGITDAYTKAQADQVTDKNRAEVLGGDIVPQMERGYISSQNGGEYWGDNRFVRTKEDYDMWLNPGAVIRLTDYSDARLTVKYIPAEDSLKETPQPLASGSFTVTKFGLYRFLITKAPVNGVLQQLTDAEVERLKGLVRVTNPTVYGMTEADAPAPLLLGRHRYKAVYVDFTVSNGAVTMTIPPNSGIVTTNGVISLGGGDSGITVNCVQSGYERVKVVYDKSDGTVKSVPHTDNAYSYILIAVVCYYLDTSALFYKVPAEVHINAPYRINNRCMGLPFSEVLTPVAVGYDTGAKRNYVEVDTVNKQIIFPAGTMIFAGESNGFVVLNNGAQFVLDYSGIDTLGSPSYYGVMKLYFDVNSQQVVISERNSIRYGAYPLVAIVRVPQSASDSTKPSISINAPAVIDGKLDGYNDQTVIKNPLLRNINHRGYNTIAPENTLPAFRLSRRMGFDYVETDIQRTKDGVYVCLHDETINRTARNQDGSEIEGDVYVVDKYYSDPPDDNDTSLLDYDFGIWKSAAYAGTKIPTLVQFVRLCRATGLKMYLELKEETLYDNVVDVVNNVDVPRVDANNTPLYETYVNEIVTIVKENGMLSHCTFISFKAPLLKSVLKACPTARVGYLCNNAGENSIGGAKALRGDTIMVDVDTITNTETTTVQRGTADVFLDIPCNVTTGNALALAIQEDFPVEVWVVSAYAEPEFHNINPYVSGFTSNKELGSNALYERYI